MCVPLREGGGAQLTVLQLWHRPGRGCFMERASVASECRYPHNLQMIPKWNVCHVEMCQKSPRGEIIILKLLSDIRPQRFSPKLGSGIFLFHMKEAAGDCLSQTRSQQQEHVWGAEPEQCMQEKMTCGHRHRSWSTKALFKSLLASSTCMAPLLHPETFVFLQSLPVCCVLSTHPLPHCNLSKHHWDIYILLETFLEIVHSNWFGHLHSHIQPLWKTSGKCPDFSTTTVKSLLWPAARALVSQPLHDEGSVAFPEASLASFSFF